MGKVNYLDLFTRAINGNNSLTFKDNSSRSMASFYYNVLIKIYSPNFNNCLSKEKELLQTILDNNVSITKSASNTEISVNSMSSDDNTSVGKIIKGIIDADIEMKM